MKLYLLVFNIDGKLLSASDKTFRTITGAKRARKQILKELNEDGGIEIYKAVEWEKITV